jgi:hypothetical protein
MLSVVMLNVIMLTVVMLSVVTQYWPLGLKPEILYHGNSHCAVVG